MTKEEKYILAKWAMEQALKSGAQQVGVSISNDKSSSVDVRGQKIEKLEQAVQSNLSISLYVDNKFSAHSTNRLNKKELKHFIAEAVEATKYLSEDKFRTLPDPSLYYKGGGVELEMLDLEYENIEPQTKIDLAFNAESEALGKDKRIVSVTSSYYDGMDSIVMVTSNGFKGDTASSYYSLYVSVSVKDEKARPSAGWNESAIFFNKLKTTEIGLTALKKVLGKLGQGKVPSAKMVMIVENRSVGKIFGPLISALNGSSVHQKNSFLINKLGKKVASGKLTLVDDPFIVSGRGSRLFDREGLASKRRTVFEEGILKNYFIDTYYGKKLEMEPTSGSTSNLVFKPGGKDLDGLVASLEKGILVTGFNGGNCNGSTGDFSYGIEGFLIEKGKLTRPVSGMNITGNMKQLWMDLAEVGSDARDDSAWRTPSLLFNNVDFSGS